MKMVKSCIHRLRYAAILTDYKTRRFIIALRDTKDYPVVFLREWVEDPFVEGDYYSLYGNALAISQAEEIMNQLKTGNTRKARSLLKKYFRDEKPYCDGVGPVTLDDMIPDEWYDAWKEMEFVITSTRHITGYWEAELEEEDY